MKKLLSFFLATIIVFALSACGKVAEKSTSSVTEESSKYTGIEMSVACIKGPTGIGMVKLMSDSESGKTANTYNFTIASSPDEISGKIVTGEINIASITTNLAAKLYNKTEGKIKILAVNTLGVLSFVSTDKNIKSIKDLKDKTVYATGEGSNPEYILRYLLEENGVANDVEIKFVATNDELVANIVSGNATVAMVPEPAATTVLSKKSDLNRVFSVNDEWEKVSDSSLMMGCVVALSSYVENNKEQVDKFLSEYKASIEYVNGSVSDAATLCEKYEIVSSSVIAQKAIPECNITFIGGKEVKDKIEGYFEVLKNADATSIGGKLPSNDFYYE